MSQTAPPASDRRFGAAVAERYESHLVPQIFEPYAADRVRRLGAAPI